MSKMVNLNPNIKITTLNLSTLISMLLKTETVRLDKKARPNFKGAYKQFTLNTQTFL